MFFTEVFLTRNSWYYKLFRFVWPGAPEFQNFCPFFWLTVLALFIVPFKAFILFFPRVLRKLYNIFEFIANILDKYVFDPLVYLSYKKYDVEEIALARKIALEPWNFIGNISVCDRLKYTKLWHWVTTKNSKLIARGIDVFSDIRKVDEEQLRLQLELLKEHFRKEGEEQKAQEKRKVSQTTKKFDYPLLIRVGKFLGYLVGCVFILVSIPTIIWCLYQVCLGIGWLWYWMWVGIWYMGQWNWINILIIILVFFVIVACCFLFIILVGKLVECPKCRKFFCDLGVAFVWIITKIDSVILMVATPVLVIFSGIHSFFSFFWKMIHTFKENNCPAIKWEEEKR